MLNKFAYLLETDLCMLECTYYNVTRIYTIDHSIMNNNQLEVLNIDINEFKLAITLKNVVSNTVLEQLHDELIK